MLGGKHHLEVYEKRRLETAEEAKETSAHCQAACRSTESCYAVQKPHYGRMGLFCPKYLFPLPNPKNDIVWGSQESQVPPAYRVKKSSKWIIWGGMTGRSLTEIHFLPTNRLWLPITTSTTHYRKKWSLSFTVKMWMKQQTSENCSVPIATWRSSKHTQPRPPSMVQKNCQIL